MLKFALDQRIVYYVLVQFFLTNEIAYNEPIKHIALL